MEPEAGFWSEEKERCVMGREWPWQVKGTALLVSVEEAMWLESGA